MEHPINKLIIVLAVIFTLYLVLRVAVPDLPLHVYHALADLPLAEK